MLISFVSTNSGWPCGYTERSSECGMLGVRILGRVKSQTEKLTHVASLVSVYHLRPRAGLVGPVSV